MKKNTGFTLVELMVVITIIALLVGIVLASLSGSRNSAKYLKRLTDIGQVNNEIVNYQLKYSKFPTTAGAWQTTGTCSALSSTATSTIVPFITMAGGIPIDPDKATNCNAGPMYAYKSDGDNYKIIVYNAQADKDTVSKKNPEKVDPIRTATSSTPSYGMWSIGGSNW